MLDYILYHLACQAVVLWAKLVVKRSLERVSMGLGVLQIRNNSPYILYRRQSRDQKSCFGSIEGGF